MKMPRKLAQPTLSNLEWRVELTSGHISSGVFPSYITLPSRRLFCSFAIHTQRRNAPNQLTS